MKPERPHLIYALLFALSLGIWCIPTSSGRVLWGLLALGTVLASYFIPLRFRPHPLGLVLGSGLLFFFNLFVLYGDQPANFVTVYNLQHIQPLTSTLLFFIVLQWYLPKSKRFDWLLFSLGLFVSFSSINWSVSEHKPIYLVVIFCLILAFMSRQTLQSIFSGTGKTQSVKVHIYIYSLLVFVLAGGISFAGVRLSEKVESQFKDSFNELFTKNQLSWSGFSGYTKLKGNQDIKLSNDIALRIKTDIPREYLRGAALVMYKNGQWFPSDLPLPAYLYKGRLPKNISALKNKTTYNTTLQKRKKTPTWTMEVTKENGFEGVIFAPPMTQTVSVDNQILLKSNPYYHLKSRQEKALKTYHLSGFRLGEVTSRIDSATLIENLQIPKEVKKKLKPLAEELTIGLKTPQEKAQAISFWFQKNFTYSLHIGNLPKDVDPTVYFVLHQQPGYCSWFASGLTLMLRSLDIPAHIVSGWRNMEYHRLSKTWIVREKEAHNWVEVLDKNSGQWLTFDPTPPQQFENITGSGQTAGWLTQFKEMILHKLERVRAFFQDQSFSSILEQLRQAATQLLSSVWFYLSLTLFLALNQWGKQQKIKKAHHSNKVKSTHLNYSQVKELDSLSQDLFGILNHLGLDLSVDLTPREIQSQLKHPQLIQALNLWIALRYGPWDPHKANTLKNHLNAYKESQNASDPLASEELTG